MTPNTVDALTNEEQVKKIQALERGAAESTRLIENLWVQNCGLVKTIVHSVTGLNAGEPGFDDMEQQSFFGFHAAIYTYDPAADIKFSTYVAKRIKWEICRYYERNGYTIRVPAFMKRRFRECLKKQQQLESELGRKVSIEATLRELGLSDSIIAGTMAAFHRMKTTSIDAEIECSGEDSDASLLDFLSSDTDMENTVISQEWHKELHRILFEALADIPGEQCSLIVRHYFNGRTFRQLAEEYHTSPQTLYNWKEAAFRSIRTGKYGKALENYHTIPTADWKRLFIDRVLETSRNTAHNEQEKRYHNLIILRYIAAEGLSTQKICKALHINRDRPNYDTITTHAIDRLLVLAFGVDGINWNDTSI